MGCCLPKSFRTSRNIEKLTMTMQDEDKTGLIDTLDNFDINRGLVMFGQDRNQKNFMLTFDFHRKIFNPIKLEKKGNLN